MTFKKTANSKLNITKFSVQCLKQFPNHIVDCYEAILQQKLCDLNYLHCTYFAHEETCTKSRTTISFVQWKTRQFWFLVLHTFLEIISTFTLQYGNNDREKTPQYHCITFNITTKAIMSKLLSFSLKSFLLMTSLVSTEGYYGTLWDAMNSAALGIMEMFRHRYYTVWT